MKLSRAIGRETDNTTSVSFVPLVQHAVIFGDDLLKHVRRDRDLKFIGVRRPDKYVPAAKFNLRLVLPEVAWPHVHSPASKSEQQGIGQQSAALIKPVTNMVSA